MGFAQSTRVHAPLSALEKVLDDFEHYKDLFVGLDGSKVLCAGPGAQARGRVDVEYDQSPPVFFLPGVKYALSYRIEKPRADAKVYRYRLKQAGRIRALDGLVLIEGISDSESRFTAMDLYDVDWGPASVFGARKLWARNLEDNFRTDAAIRLKAEHPDWDAKKVREQAEEAFEGFDRDAFFARKPIALMD
jgi:hypothetical protein